MDLAFCLKVPLDSLLLWASSEGSGETARIRRLAWTFAARIGDKYQIRLTRSIWSYWSCWKVRFPYACAFRRAYSNLFLFAGRQFLWSYPSNIRFTPVPSNFLSIRAQSVTLYLNDTVFSWSWNMQQIVLLYSYQVKRGIKFRPFLDFDAGKFSLQFPCFLFDRAGVYRVSLTSNTSVIWAPSSEFVSSSIPSWQISTAHVQPFRGGRDLGFCLKVPLDSLPVWASSGGSGETARMRRLAWTFAFRIGDKYQIRLTRSICSVSVVSWSNYMLTNWSPAFKLIIQEETVFPW